MKGVKEFIKELKDIIKELIQLLEQLDKLMIRIISFAGWVVILIIVLRGC